MALRITQAQLPSEPEPADVAPAPSGGMQGYYPAPVTPELELLVRRAGAALTANQSAAYLETFNDAAALQDPHRRYQARRVLVEQAIGLAPNLSERAATGAFLAMAHGAIGVLEENPAEPLLLNYAGIAFYELWSLDAARALFHAAQRLDPALPHIDKNLKAINLRARSHGPKSAAFHPALKQLSARALKVARRAKPAQGLTLSLCMIVRDEEEMLPRSLAAAASAVDEIVIVDTGSQDRTIEIAKSFGARVIEREWTGSFSDARNASFDAATSDWLLYLDADEVLIEADIEKLRELSGQTWREAFYLLETNFTGVEELGTSIQHSALRVFRNRPEYRFRGRLHEQITPSLPTYLPERIAETSVRLDHYGYLGVVRDAKDKARRNIELLLAQQQESPDDAFLRFNLGAEYSATGEHDKALVEFEQSWNMAELETDLKLEFVPSLANRIVATLQALGRQADAIRRADLFLERFPGFTDLVYKQGVAASAAGDVTEAIRYFEQAMEMGDAPAKYTALVGAGTYLPRISAALIHVHSGAPERALELMEWCTEHHPDVFLALEPYALALLRTGKTGSETVSVVEGRLGSLTKTQEFILGTVLYEAGFAAEAEVRFRAVLAAQPHSGHARGALVEALLYQKRYAEAVSEAARLTEDDPVAAKVIRSELFARLLARDLDGVPEAMERATRIGLPQAEHELFEIWAHRLGGETSERPVPIAATPLLERMLDSLLRVQDFENFELLVGLYVNAGLPERERRERLAQMYLRHGFIKSAAREWLAVAQKQPDTRALTGLTRVAIANGQIETAHSFANQGLALDPGNRELRALANATSASSAV